MYCSVHPWSEMIGGSCGYCRLANLLRHCRKRRLPRPPHLLLSPRLSDAQATRHEDERLGLLGITRPERLKLP